MQWHAAWYLASAFFVLHLPVFLLQELPKGYPCEGEKRDLCAPGTMCEDNVCRLVLGGGGCVSVYSGLCRSGLACDVATDACLVAAGGECRNSSMCLAGHSCDVMSKCRRSAGETCSSDSECVAGSVCTQEVCTCRKDISQKRGGLCEPLKGQVGGECGEGGTCKDPHAICNVSSLLCHCQQSFSVNVSTFACLVNAGQRCNGDRQNLCEDGTFCDLVLNTCRVAVGESCDGERGSHCETDLCIEGLCRAGYGTECENLPYDSCRPDGFCMYSYGDRSFRCRISEGEVCRNYSGWCMRGLVCDPVSYTCKRELNPISANCWRDDQCPAGARCRGHRCKCTYTQSSLAPQERLCGLPQGKVGAACQSQENATRCEDAHARCNRVTGLCECKTGYVTDLNRAKCELGGPKCSLFHDHPNSGSVKTFFGETIPVHLPCSFKMANIQCGASTAVEVIAHRAYSNDINDTFTSGIDIVFSSIRNDDDDDDDDDNNNISNSSTGSNSSSSISSSSSINSSSSSSSKAEKGTMTQIYSITQERIEMYLQGKVTKLVPWDRRCQPQPCVEDPRVQLSVKAKTGKSLLKRGLLKVTYEPARFRRDDEVGNKDVVKTWGRVDIECGHPKMKALETYPQAICGSPSDTAEVVWDFRRGVEVELKRDTPGTFGFVSRGAFQSARLSDHAVLRTQSVRQNDSLCKEASEIVRGECRALTEVLYNCSSMYDPHQPVFTSYVTCVNDVMPPMKLYVTCLRVLCGRYADKVRDTCDTLGTASRRCDDKMGLVKLGITPPHSVLASDLMTSVSCSTLEN